MAEAILSAVIDKLAVAYRISQWPVVRQINYLFFSKRNVDNLRKKVMKLREMRHTLQDLVEVAERERQLIEHAVQRWLVRAEQIEEEVYHILEHESNWCPNPKSRYSLSKKAVNMNQEVAELLEEGSFISYAPARSRRGTEFLNFPSRKEKMEVIMDALRDDTIRVIGIWGPKGIGKTTMAKMILEEVEEKNMFDRAVMVVVSQVPDVMQIQEEVGDQLGFHIESRIESTRAKELNEKITRIIVGHRPSAADAPDSKLVTKSTSLLIVFDDVFSVFDFEQIGLPSPGTHKSYKIVLTSRTQDVCHALGSQRIFDIQPLEPQETLELFWKKAGEITNDSLEKRFIEDQILAECGGLPMAIALAGAQVGRGLEKFPWCDNLQQLKTAKSRYTQLPRVEDKKLFLLCCMFPEDSDIPIESLVRYGLAFGVFNEGFIREARKEVHLSIDKLKSSSLLLDGSGKSQFVKMKVVRQLAMRIASERDEFGIMSTLKWYYKQPLSLEELEVEPPKILDLSIISINEAITPSIFHLLKNLHTLSLHYCRLGGKDLSSIAELEHLEILSFAHSDLEKLNSKMGFPRTLKLLDVTKCEYLKTIEPGLLSSLIQLEELYTLGSPVKWEICEEGKEATNASAAELVNLSRLTSLTIHVPLAEHLPKDLLLATNLTRFQIYIGEFSCSWDENIHGFTNRLSITGPEAATCTSNHFKDVSYSAHAQSIHAEVSLKEIESVESRVRSLELKSEMMQLFQENNQIGITAFQNLSSLELFLCNDMRHMFSSATAKNFVKLHTLKILKCEMVEEVIVADDQEGEKLVFPELRTLVLKHLPRLKSFCTAESCSFEWPSLETVRVKDIPSMKTFASGSHIAPRLKAIHVTFLDKCWKGDLNTTFQHIYNTQGNGKFEATIEDTQEGTSSSQQN